LTELRASDLRFTPTEAAEFLNTVMGLNLSAQDVAALESRTEGWIAGLQLAALAMQGTAQGEGNTTDFIQSFTGSHRFVLDYLAEEVLQQQTESIQTFLLRTAILDRLTGSLCDALLFGEAEQPTLRSSAATLEVLEHANLFIVPLDGERRWYRYHHLFADLLRQRLRQTQPEQIPVLHIRASRWYEENALADEAIEHALRAEDFDRAASLIGAHIDATWKRAEHNKLGRWLVGLPSGVLITKPQLCIYSAWMLFAVGQRDTADQLLKVAERALYSRPDDKRLRGRLAAVRALMLSWWGDVPGIIEHARIALECLDRDDPWRGPAAVALGDAYDFQDDLTAAYRARLEAVQTCKAAGDVYFYLIANVKVAITLRAQGRLQQTIDLCRQQLEYADEHGLSQTSVAGCFLAQWGEVLAELNDLDGALERATKGAELTEGSDLVLLSYSHLCLIAVLVARGDLAAAEEVVQKLEQLTREHDLPAYITNPTAAWRATLWLLQGNLEAASQWVCERALDPDQEPDLMRRIEYGILVRVWLAQGNLDDASRLLRRLVDAVERGERIPTTIEVLNLQALVFQAQGEHNRALDALSKALALAEPGGFIRTFVGAGPPMARLLQEALRRNVTGGASPAYVRRLLAAFPLARPEPAAEAERPAPPRAGPSRPDLIEPLSEREIEVLELISEGLTNPEIAARLYLALNTVKAHTRNIYGKLGVHNRTQAVARARALGVLPTF
jgi:LuxR family maltose regulon positive regulatory protein